MASTPLPRVPRLADYEPLVGPAVVGRLRRKAAKLQGLHVVHVSSTYYGGGVAELLSSLSLLMNDAGLPTGWRVLQGRPDFFSITKKLHNALQGGEINLSDLKMQIYDEVLYENALRNHLGHDAVVVHDPQPAGLIEHYRRRVPWIWRCHVDMSAPHAEAWEFLARFVDAYDAVIFSCDSYHQPIRPPQLTFMPAIDPFSTKNREIDAAVIDDRLVHYEIPCDLPLVVQVSRFDRWKDPEGVIEAVRKVQEQEPCTLVLLGNVATDDPEGQQVFESLLGAQNERIRVLSCQDSVLVNALQRRAAVVVQKSLREGFGLTVTEAMWKGAAVVAGNAGGIRHQIDDGVSGYLVNSVDEAAARILELLRDEGLRRRLGEKARARVKERFLMTRLLEQYLDLFGALEPVFYLRPVRRDGRGPSVEGAGV